MFDRNNLYTLQTEIVDGIAHDYVLFNDGQAVSHKVEVSYDVYLEFLRFVVIERKMRHWDERHKEYSKLTEETLVKRAELAPKSAEETVFDNMFSECVIQAIKELPKIQRKRFVMYYEFGLTYEQIADIDGCTKIAVKYTIDKAKLSIVKKIKVFEE